MSEFLRHRLQFVGLLVMSHLIILGVGMFLTRLSMTPLIAQAVHTAIVSDDARLAANTKPANNQQTVSNNVPPAQPYKTDSTVVAAAQTKPLTYTTERSLLDTPATVAKSPQTSQPTQPSEPLAQPQTPPVAAGIPTNNISMTGAGSFNLIANITDNRYSWLTNTNIWQLNSAETKSYAATDPNDTFPANSDNNQTESTPKATAQTVPDSTIEDTSSSIGAAASNSIAVPNNKAQ